MSRLKPVDKSYDSGAESVWYLEGFVDESRILRRIPLHPLPFRVGRHPNLELSLASDSVSQEHAEIHQVSGLLRIRDLASTNGTYINRRPVTNDMVLLEGDILHIASLEFVLARATRQEFEELMGKTVELDLDLPQPLVEQVRSFKAALQTDEFDTVFQPILSLKDDSVLGYEMLGRGHLEALPEGAYELFNIAASIGAEAALSRLFRAHCIDDCLKLPDNPTVFFNTHPAELSEPGLVRSLREVREKLPDHSLVLEIHEVAITEPRMIRKLRSRLLELDIGLAYDDFGTGQARLVDVVEVPPDYLKFDISLIRGVDQLMSKQRMLESLVGMVSDLGIISAAEGIETPEEAEVCRQLGFQYGQGYYLGRPEKAQQFRLTG